MTYERLVYVHKDVLLFEDSPGDSRRLVGTNLAGGVIFESPVLFAPEVFTGWPVFSKGHILVPTNKGLYRLQLDPLTGKLDAFWGIPARIPQVSSDEACFGTLAVIHPGSFNETDQSSNIPTKTSGDGVPFVLSLSPDRYIVYKVTGR